MLPFYDHTRIRAFFKKHTKGIALFLAGVAFLFVELFTPLAPLERFAGFWVAHMPKFELSTLVGKDAADRFENLDAVMDNYMQKQTVYDAGGRVITKADNPDSIPTFLGKYLLGVENSRFYNTYVIDWRGVIRAAVADISEGHFSEGGSGIIQQFSRGIILHDDKKFWQRKKKEVLIGLGLGDRYTHRQLLHFYMSSVFLGSFSHPVVQIRGFQDGAYDLFGKDISKITQPEGLALVALISRPNLYLKSTADFREVYQKRAEFLKEKHIISKSDYQNLIQNIPKIDTTMVKTRALDLEYHGQIAEQLKPAGEDNGPIHSTVDLKVTDAARNVLASAVKSIRKETGIYDLDGFIVVAHYDSILAMVGSEQRGDRYMNNLEIRSAWRPGSLVKPLIYSEFISQGGDIHQKLPADGPKIFNTLGGEWTVKNYSSLDNTPSMQPAIDALARSNNVAAAYLAVNYGDSLQQRLRKAGIDSTFSPYPATFIGADATKPMNLFRLLQAYVPPYGEIPDHFITEKSDISPYDPLFPYDVARQTAYCLTYALKDPKGTLHFTEDRYDWSSTDYLGKTGTAQANTSAGLFVARPNGVSVLMGLFSRSGKPLNYLSGGAAQGASLAPYLHQLFEAPSIRSRVKGQFDFKPYENRQPAFVQTLDNFFNKVGSVGKKLWNSLKGGD